MEEYLKIMVVAFLSAFGGGVATMLLAYPKRVKEREKENLRRMDAMEEGIRAMLRDTIQKEHNKICAPKRQYAKSYEKENVSNLFKAYVKLGGNSYIERLYDQIMNKPIGDDLESITK